MATSETLVVTTFMTSPRMLPASMAIANGIGSQTSSRRPKPTKASTTTMTPATRLAPAISSKLKRLARVPRKISAERLDVVAKGWRYTSDRTNDETAPVAQMMNIQEDAWVRSRPNEAITAICTGTMPTAYHRKVVRPAHAAA